MPVVGATVVFGHHPGPAPRQPDDGLITGVRFQCAVSAVTLRAPWSGDEVLEYVQTFTEVRGDWRFDDGAVRLRHQTTHSRPADESESGRETTRTGVGHHKDAVEGKLLFHFGPSRLTTSSTDRFSIIAFGNAFVCGSPDIDHFVVASAGGHQTRLELLLISATSVSASSMISAFWPG